MTNKYTSCKPLPDICAGMIRRLETELSPRFLYHSATHTKEVVQELREWCDEDSLSPKDTELLLIAGAFHDSGFLESEDGDERIGARIARDAMTYTGRYSHDEIKLVELLIMDTQILIDPSDQLPKQIPHHPLSNYLLDADMSNLGREDFIEKAKLLAEERSMLDAYQDFLLAALAVVKAKTWYSPAGKRHRSQKHQQNLQNLINSINQEPSSS